jgi:uncharacterized lipoprotein YajG
MEKGLNMKKLLSVLLVIFIALTFTACRAPNNAQTNAQAQPMEPTTNQSASTSAKTSSAKMDAGAIVEAFGARRNLPQVQGSGVVEKVLKDDTKGLKHQKFLLKVSDNITILIAHNIDLAPRVADIQAGDVVEYKGEYIYTPKGGTVHWTHKDPRGHHEAGFLKHNGKTYE